MRRTTRPPEDVNDVEKSVDFIGHDHFNVGGIDDKPDEDDPFGLFGVGFGEFQRGVELADMHVVSSPKKPKSI